MESLLIGLAAALLLFAFLAYSAKAGIDWDRKSNSHLIDSENWLGPFYVNSNDKRIFLQKRRAGGYTINLGNPAGVILILIFIGLLIWVLYLGA